MTNTTKSLRKDVNAARGVEAKSVIRFDRTFTTRDNLRDEEGPEMTVTYAAIFVAGSWFLTGRGRMASRSYTHREFVDLLADPGISNIEVATEFEAL